MERLTTRPQAALVKCCSCDEESYCYSDIGCNEIDKAFAKLKDYEDAEENGFLLRLPVALGQPCYVIERCKCNFRYKCRAQNSTTARVKAKIVKDWKQYGNMRYCLKIYERPFKVGYMQFYGKTVFATLEEAHKVVTELAERG